MKKNTKLDIAATGTGLSLIIGGVGVANATTSRPPHAVNVFAGTGANGQGPFNHVLAVLVANGTITQAQADAILKEAAAERAARETSRGRSESCPSGSRCDL